MKWFEVVFFVQSQVTVRLEATSLKKAVKLAEDMVTNQLSATPPFGIKQEIEDMELVESFEMI